MATTIQNLHSLTAGNQPGDLLPGEVAYNVADGFTYIGDGTSNYTDTLGQVIGPSSEPGMGWQQGVFNAAPVPGAVTLAGIYDAQANLVTSVTAQGTAAGFIVGALPAAAAGNSDFYVLVQIGGILTPPAPTGVADPGDWLVSTGTGWALVKTSQQIVPAENVTITPTGWITGPNLQQALNQVVLNAITTAGGGVSFLNVNGDLEVYGNTELGNANTDTVTVAATSTFQAPVTVNATITGNSSLTVATTGAFGTNLSAAGNLTVGGNTALGNTSTDTVTATGPVTLQNNLTVTQTTQLNGTTQINGALTTTGQVAFTGSTRAVSVDTATFTVDGTTTVVTATGTSITFNSAYIGFSTSSNVSFYGNVLLGSNANAGRTTTYSRSATITEVMNNFLVVPGTIISFGGNNPPAGYVLCDGRTLATTGQYADLFAAIGTTWGGSGATFKLPDLRGMFLRGTGTNALYTTSTGTAPTAAATGTFQRDAYQSHNHNILDNGGQPLSNNPDFVNVYDTLGTGQGSSLGGTSSTGYLYGGKPYTGTSGFSESRPVNVSVLYCIKY
jgi:microcystin-dependent protein